MQQNRYLFERNLERIGAIAGYEISKHLSYRQATTQTPMGKAKTRTLADTIVIVSVLRAGLPVQKGLSTVFDDAGLGFVTARRTEVRESNGFAIDVSYIAAPTLNNKTLIIADTTIATGHTAGVVYAALVQSCGKPKEVYIAGVIASQNAIDFLSHTLPQAKLYICQVDPALNQDFFIVPGLGDAGDILYGQKAAHT